MLGAGDRDFLESALIAGAFVGVRIPVMLARSRCKLVIAQSACIEEPFATALSAAEPANDFETLRISI